MGMKDKFRDKAEDVVEKLGGADKTKDHIGEAADKADSATGGRYEEHIDKAERGAESMVDKFDQREQDR